MARQTKIVLSDLHLGAGSFDGENPLEDFHHDETFHAFLLALRAESEQANLPIELIINGDMIEFLQIPAVPLDAFDPAAEYSKELYRSTTEADSLLRAELAIAGHPEVFAGLRAFLSETPRRSITIIKGNHDIHLHWPAVQQRIREAIGATGEHAHLVSFVSRAVRREGIHVEHGNQYQDRLNALENFENPVDPQNPDQLVLPPGAHFVFEFLNSVEREKWWVDAIKPAQCLIAYGLTIDPLFTLKALYILLTAIPSVVFHALKAEPDDPFVFLREKGPEQTISRYQTNPDFRQALQTRVYEFTTTPIDQALRPATNRSTAQLIRNLCKGPSEHLTANAQELLRDDQTSIVVFGHTHQPLLIVTDGGIYVNSGTWVWWRDLSDAPREVWERLYHHPEEFTATHYLTYARIDYTEDGTIHANLIDLSGSLIFPSGKVRGAKVGVGRKGCRFW